MYDDIEKVIEEVTDLIDGFTRPYADKDKYSDYIKSAYESEDSPPDNEGVVYSNLNDYDSNCEISYNDGEYSKK